MTEEYEDHPSTEGSYSAAYDLADARFRIADKRHSIYREESARRAVKASSGLLVIFWGLTALLNLSHPKHVPLLWVDIAVALISATAMSYGLRYVVVKNRKVSELRLEITKLRDAERDAKFRMPHDGIRRLLWTYHSDTLSVIDEYRDEALHYRRIANRFQTVIIIGSLMVTGITTAAAQYRNLEWVGVFASFFVAVSAGMTGYFKFRERSMNLQQAADNLERECKAVELGISVYRPLRDERDRLAEFAERAERIKEDQRNREQQLEQPPDTRSSTGQSAGTS